MSGPAQAAVGGGWGVPVGGREARSEPPALLAAFRALLQIRAVRKKPGALSPISFSPVLAQTLDHDEHSVSSPGHPCPSSLVEGGCVCVGGGGTGALGTGFLPPPGLVLWPARAGLGPGRRLEHGSLSPSQCSDNIPPGYEPLSLLEALNGLRSTSPPIPSAPLYEEITCTGVLDGLPASGRPLVGLDRAVESSHPKGKRSKSPDR